jgi:dihydrofolate synthase/folylpolyglutamate synthase
MRERPGSLRKMATPRRLQTDLTRAETLAWLDRRINYERGMPAGRGPVLGLERMRRLLRAIGSPQKAFPVVHVAGTKGKGSTVAMISAILDAAGYRVGRYMSPHVHRLEERIAINGEPIDEAALVAAFAEVIPRVEALDAAAAKRAGSGPTWFEVVTAVALLHFARSGVEIAVLETGLGGRLDATNVTRPLLSVITSISLDHMRVLGPTLGRIATEKAGIIKRGCMVISGATAPAARRVIVATAARRRAPLLQLDRDFSASHVPHRDSGPLAAGSSLIVELPARYATTTGRERYPLAMAGSHQAANASLAVVAAHALGARGLKISSEAIASGLARASLPARIEVVSKKPLLIVDAAHNVASMRALLDTLREPLDRLRPRVLVFAASEDKQIERMLSLAVDRFDHVVITRYATNPRAAGIDRLIEACHSAGLPEPRLAATPRAAVRMAKELAGRPGLVCVAGSFFLAAEI